MKKTYPHKAKFVKQDDQKLVQQILTDYANGAMNLTMPLDCFRGRSIISKMDEWKNTWDGYPNFETDTEEDLLFIFKFARSQLKNQASIINQANIRAEYEAMGKDKMVSKVVSNGYKVVTEYYEHKIGKKALDLEQIIKVGIEGTVFAEVFIDKESIVGDVIDEFDPETGSYSTKEVQRVLYNGPRIKLHSIEDILLENPFEKDIQKQGFIISRKTISYEKFWMDYKNYPGADEVKAGEYTFPQEDGRAENSQSAGDLASNLDEGTVEIVRYWRKNENLHAIVANGVVLYQGPIISQKVNYPFAVVKHDLIDGSDIIYGNSFMENIGSEAGLLTYLYNILIKKQLLAANPVMLTENEEDSLDGKIEAGDIKIVQDIVRNKIMQFPGVDGGDSQMIGMLRESMQNNSNNAQGGGGVTGMNGGVGTARQVITAQEQAMRVIGMDATMLEECERQKKILLLDIIREFIKTPEIEKITRDGEVVSETKKYERDVKFNDQQLNGGKRGSVLIHFYKKGQYYKSNGEKITIKKRVFNDGKSQIEDTGEPKVNDIIASTKEQAKQAEKMGEPMDILYMPIEVFDDFDFDVTVVPGSSTMDSKTVEFQKRQMFVQTIAPFLGPSLNGIEIAAFFAEVYDYDVDRFVAEQQPVDPQQQAIQQAEAGFDPMEEGAILQEFTA